MTTIASMMSAQAVPITDASTDTILAPVLTLTITPGTTTGLPLPQPAVAPQAMSTQPVNPGVAGTRPSPAAQASPQAPMASPVQGSPVIDLAQGPFLGGSPSSSVDLPLTVMFLLLFITGAYTHISIYRANSRRGHKFLLSDLMFNFCTVRTVTCILRILWIFKPVRAVILLAQIVQFGG
jgi:hypothetical protein